MKKILPFLFLILLGALAAEAKPVKVFLLSGQSNMTGRGSLGITSKPAAEQKGTLWHFIQKPENREKFHFLYQGPKKTETGWMIRKVVFITMGDWPHLKLGEEGFNAYNKHGGLSSNYGGRGNRGFGPEFAIGHLLGNHYEEKVLLVKVAFGGNSLNGNFRPPSSGGKLGDKYPLMIKALREALEKLPEIIDGATKEQGHDLAGFFWNQGLSDALDSGMSLVSQTADVGLRRRFSEPSEARLLLSAVAARDESVARPHSPPDARWAGLSSCRRQRS